MQTLWAASYPTDTTQYYEAGNIVINNAPSIGQPYGWVCVTAGYAGTWYPIFLNRASVLSSTLSSAATYASGYANILANPANATTAMALPLAGNHAAGFGVRIINVSANSLTLAPASTESYAPAAAITLAQWGVVNLVAGGSTVWYKGA